MNKQFLNPIRVLGAVAVSLCMAGSNAEAQCNLAFPPGTTLSAYVTTFPNYNIALGVPAGLQQPLIGPFGVDVVNSISGNPYTSPVGYGLFPGWCVNECSFLDTPFITVPGGLFTGPLFSTCDPNLNSELPPGHSPDSYVSPQVWLLVDYILNNPVYGGTNVFYWSEQAAINTLVGSGVGCTTHDSPSKPLTTPIPEGEQPDGNYFPTFNPLVVQGLLEAATNGINAGWTPGCGDVIAAVWATVDPANGTYDDQFIIIPVPMPLTVSAPNVNLICNSPAPTTADVLKTVVATPGAGIQIIPGPITQSTSCTYTQVFTITATCGNNSQSTTATYTWTEDATPPTFYVGSTPVTGPLPPVSFYCYEDALAYSNSLAVTAVDNCSGSPAPTPILCFHSESNPGNSCDNTITLTWCATNQCGVSGSLVQIISINNTNYPTLNVPPGYNYGCNPSYVTNATDLSNSVTASSFCGDAPKVVITQFPDNINNCLASRVFNVTVTDACGNQTSKSVTYNWTANTTPPTINPPTGSNLGCNPANLPTIASVQAGTTATGNCGETTTITVTTPGPVINNCLATQVFNITAIDSCNNTSTASVTYNWTANTTPPTINPPTGSNLGCNPANLPTCATVKAGTTATGNCGETTTITVTTPGPVINNCLATQVFNITAIDSCNNTSTASVTYNWTANTTPPTINPPTGSNLGCNPANLPTIASVQAGTTATGNCGETTTITVTTPGPVINNCLATQVFNITAIDSCNNTSTASVTYNWTANTTPPTINPPTGSNLGCNPANLPTCATVKAGTTATGNCGETTTITVTTPGPVVNNCLATQVFNITAIDSCNNTSTASVTYNWTANTTPPTINPPTGSNLGCNPANLPTIASVQAGTTATGNCGETTTITVTTPGPVINNCLATQVFNITAIDSCNNTSTASVTYNWTANTTPPTINPPTGSNLGCNPASLPTIATVQAGTTATGNCGETTTITVTTPGPVINNCLATQVFNITAIDSCNNTSTASVTYNWTANTTPPTINPLTGSNLGCNPANLPTIATVKAGTTATGNCGETTTITVTTPGPVINSCLATQVFNITAIDSCNNTSTASVTYNWTANTTPPTINPPTGSNLGCNPANLPTIATVKAGTTASGNCGETTTITVTTPGPVINSCLATQVFNITAIDSCNNTSTASVTYNWTANTTPPTIKPPTGSNLGCNPANLPTIATVKAGTTATGNCGETTTITVTTPGPVINSCLATQVFNITAIDSCNNTSTASVTYNWTANTTPPTIKPPTGSNLGCNPVSLPTIATVKAGTTATGNCGETTTITVTTPGPVINGCLATQVFNIAAIDSCNNTSTASVTYNWTVNTTKPTINGVPQNANLGCNPVSTLIPTCAYIKGLVTATGYCATTVSVNVTNVDSTNGCSAQREFIITATDSCGNIATAYVTYSWTVDAGPTITCPPTVTISTNCQFVYCTFGCGDWGGACNNGYYGWGNYGNSWWNNWCQQNNNNDCTSSFNNWWLNCNGANGGGTTWWKSWNSQNCGGGWWSGWSSSYNGSWWGCWNKNNYSSSCFVPCSGNNPGSVLCNNFNRLYPNGCTIGCANGYSVTCDSWQAVQQCLGFNGNPGKLNCNSTDPSSCSAGSFCSQVLCLKLNCDFGDDGCSSGANFFGPFGDCVINNPSLPCYGKRVRDVCAIAQNCLGGATPPAGCTVSQLCNLVSCLNQCFQGCKVSSWCNTNISPVINPPPSQTGYPVVLGGCSSIIATNYTDVTTPMSCPGGYTITRTWTAIDACGMSNSCEQTINISQSPQSTVAGKVVLSCSGDSDLNNNAGFSNVVVTLKQGSTAIATDTTDVDGNYAFDDVPAGTYTVVVTVPSGYSETSPSDGKNSQTITVGDCQSGAVPAFGYIGSTPALTLMKCGPFCATNGQTIPYAFTVVNTGNSCLNITVTDPMLGGVILTSNSVPPGTIITFTNTYLITNKNVCAITNIATAKGVSGSKTATSTATAVTLLMTKPCASSVCGSFNSYNPAGGFVWCNAHLVSPPKTPCTISCQGGSVTFSCRNGHVYNYPVPDCQVTFSTSCSTPTSYFDGSCWNITVPCNGDDQIPLSCFGIPWNNDFAGCQNVCWNANFSCDQSGYTCNWTWGPACYKGCDLSNCGQINSKPCHNTYCSGYVTGENSCTPENFKNYCVSGGTGSGYGNYCGNWSSTGSVTCH